MKKHFIILLLLFIQTFCMAQENEVGTKTDIIAQKIKSFYNDHNLEAIYALTNAGFQKAIPLPALKKAFDESVFINGKIENIGFVKNKKGVSKYRLDMANGKLMQMIVALDGSDSIKGFAMQPFQEELKESDKRRNFYNDNALKTHIDSLVHQYATNFMETSKSPGLAIGILVGTESYFYNYGEAKTAQEIHPTRNTVFEIGSITKTFTAFLLADAVMKNKVKLDDPITKYLPDSVAANVYLQRISILQLANHTSGLPSIPDDLFTVAKDTLNPYAQYDNQHLFAFLQSYKTNNKSGEKYEYSNLGFGLLGVILEKINKMPLAEQYRKTIFSPLKITETYVTGIKDSSMTALGYNKDGKQTSYWDFKSFAGCGAIKSTTADLIKYAAFFALMPRTKGKYDDRVLLLQKITFAQNLMPVSLGWHFYNNDTTGFTMWHNGGTGGFSSYLAATPSKKLAIVLLNNYAGEPSTAATGRQLMDVLLNEIK